MAIYHCSIKIGSRSKGQSAIAAAAYRAGDKLKDEETGLVSDYSRKGGVVFSEISLCENAPVEYADRATLWNAVHEIENAKNSQLWREFEVALPQELNREKQIETVRDFVRLLTAQGMCADWSIHDKNDGNPHAHIMTTMRSITEKGEWAPKSRKVYDLDENGNRIFQKVDKSGRKQYKSHKEDYNDWNRKEKVEEWRAAWAECCNAGLAERDRIDHRSYERQGIEQEPTIHEGYTARKIAANGGSSDRILINQEIRSKNAMLRELTEQIEAIERQIAELVKEKGSAINAGKQRIADLLARRSRAIADDDGGIAGRERNTKRKVRKAAPTESDILIRQSKAERRAAILNAGLTEGGGAEQEIADTGTAIETAIERGRAAIARSAANRRAGESDLEQSSVKTESAAAHRAERDAERERLAAEERRRAEEERRRAEEAEREAAARAKKRRTVSR